MNYYTVYLNATDEIVASGTARECAAQLQTSINCFYSLVSKNRYKHHKKYTFFSEPYESTNNLEKPLKETASK